MSDSTQHHSNTTGKCLCPYCSGSIARGMQKLNDDNLTQCYQLIETSQPMTDENLQQLTNLLDSLNPVQCFDVLDKWSSQYSSTAVNDQLDNLIIKLVERFRDNGGFFLALKEPQDRRQHLLQRLRDLILVKENNIEKLRLSQTEVV